MIHGYVPCILYKNFRLVILGDTNLQNWSQGAAGLEHKFAYLSLARTLLPRVSHMF